LERAPVGYAYGALAAGADILWAEALLEHEAELHVVLPLAREEFVRASVAPAGAAWVERFHRCLDAATTVEYATDDALGGDDVLFRYGSELAMGLALLRARFLDAQVRQLGVWDRGGAHGEAGTAIDIATWRRGGRPTTAIDPVGQRWEVAGTIPAPIAESPAQRVVRALLFADIRGFSKLADEQYPWFDRTVTAAFARVLDQAEGVATVNTWGDALHVVLDDAVAAASCALGLQEAMSSINLHEAGLPEHLALRLAAHLGPVLPSFDPIRRVPIFTGSHVSRTARIEPVTPPGAIYVTSAFAAALLLGGREELACDYVGHMPAAKDWGRLRMYRLRRRSVQPVP
ncbi:MAG TPA: adenylate/guanylate cyclase domain-containing protein, partial [Methylomirabilota bacterium]